MLAWFKDTFIGKIFEGVLGIVDQYVEDVDKKSELKAKIVMLQLETEAQAKKYQAEALMAELQGSKLQRSWRPHLMYVIMAILVYVEILNPILTTFGLPTPAITLSPEMYTLMTVSLGGYTVARTADKGFQAWADSKAINTLQEAQSAQTNGGSNAT